MSNGCVALFVTAEFKRSVIMIKLFVYKTCINLSSQQLVFLWATLHIQGWKNISKNNRDGCRRRGGSVEMVIINIMCDNRGIPKCTVSELESELSSFTEHDTCSPRKSCSTAKSSSSVSTYTEIHQVRLGSLIDECSKGAYSTANRSSARKRLATTTDTTDTINNMAEALEDVPQTPARRNRKWTQKEVKRLHRCVEIFGTDFSIIASMFPNRRRSELMNKFKKEGKKNVETVHKTLSKHQDMRLSKHLSRKSSLRKESLVSVNSLDSADINLVNEVIKLVQQEN